MGYVILRWGGSDFMRYVYSSGACQYGLRSVWESGNLGYHCTQYCTRYCTLSTVFCARIQFTHCREPQSHFAFSKSARAATNDELGTLVRLMASFASALPCA
eukprot:7323688-Prymnesium_polylepis.1